MAIDDAYATNAQYRSRIDKTDTRSDDDIDANLIAISRYLEKKLGRFFNVDTVDQTRVYMTNAARQPLSVGWAESENPWKFGALQRALNIDDLVSLTSIIIDQNRDGSFVSDTPLTSVDYELLPRNATLGPEPQPYRSIELTSWGSNSLYYFPPQSRVQIIGRFGWPAVPQPIIEATIQLCAILRVEGPRATIRVDEMGNSIELSGEAKSIVRNLTREYVRTTKLFGLS